MHEHVVAESAHLQHLLDAFVMQIGTVQGADVMHDVPHHDAPAEELQVAEHIVAQPTTQRGRRLDTTGIRCITWCPVGIDITEEVRALRDSPLPESADRQERRRGDP